jgi:hypothetical protein
MDRTRAGRGRRWWSLMLVALTWASGCATFQNDEPNFRDDTAKWGEMNRPVKIGSGFGGVSSESQQIERNLGIR